jgi:hypothetical protein
MTYPRITPSDPDYPRWSRSAATTVNLLAAGVEAADGRLTTAETDIVATQADVTGLQSSDTSQDARLVALETATEGLSSILKLTPLAAEPASPAEGWVYADSVTHKLRYYEGTTWIDLH